MLKPRYKVGDIVIPKKSSNSYINYKKMKITAVDLSYKDGGNSKIGIYYWDVMFNDHRKRDGFVNNSNSTGIALFEQLTIPETEAGKILFGDKHD